MTPHYVNQRGELNWLLNNLVDRVPQVTSAVMLTQDGLAIGASADLSREEAEHLAALPQLTPQPRDVPSAGSGYSPYPMTAGQSDPASYAG